MRIISLTLLTLLFFSELLFSQKIKTQNKVQDYSEASYKIIQNGEAKSGLWKNKINSNPVFYQNNYHLNPDANSPSYIITLTYTGCSTIYDYLSEGVPQNIILDAENLNNLHLVCMFAPPGDGPNFPNRRTIYYCSSNGGVNWTYGSNITNIKSGFPAITLTSDGCALITLQVNGTGNSQTTHWYRDVFPQLCSFNEVVGPVSGTSYLWPKTVAIGNYSVPSMFVTVSSIDNPLSDSCAWISYGATFSPWHPFNSSKGEGYSISKGTDGRIGIAYKVSENSTAERGSVYFMESTNNGSSFGAPTKIYNASINPSGDSLGVMRGISLAYQGNVPKVTFELIKRDGEGNFFPNSKKNQIRFWSSSLPGSDPNRSIVIADTSKMIYHPYINTGTLTDPFACFCRPSVGTTKNGTCVVVVFMSPSGYTGGSADTISYMDIYMVLSYNGGNTWGTPARICTSKDWTYPCFSQNNIFTGSSDYSFCFSVLSDSIPGSYINNPANGESRAKYYSVKYQFTYYPPPPPQTPSLISPPNGSSNLSVTPVFTWGSTGTNYVIQISTSNTFSNTVVNSYLGTSQFNTPAGILSINTTYYWRVNAQNDYGTSPWSDIWSFSTTSNGIKEYSTEIPSSYKLHNNFPNPFNPVTKIRFDLPISSAVKLIIYDVTGRIKDELINRNLSAGKFELEWNASNMASGIYFCKLEAGDFTEIKKLVLLK